MNKQEKYKLKSATERIDGLFAETWKKSNPAYRDFNATGTECLSMIMWYRVWRAVTAFCLLLNAACVVFGSWLVFELRNKETALFWFVTGMFALLQVMLLFWAYHQLKGEGRPVERMIPGKAAHELAASWRLFWRQFKMAGMSANLKDWIVSRNRDMYHKDEVTAFFVQILNEKVDYILQLEAAGKEDKKAPVRRQMSQIYDLNKPLGLTLPDFRSFFPNKATFDLVGK